MRESRVFVLLTLLLALACGLPSGGETPVAPAHPSPAGRCGDGVCDEREQRDRSLCPQDCPASPSPADAAATPASDQSSDITFAEVEGVPLALDAYLPDTPGPHPAVILIHGGCWQTGDKMSHRGLGEKLAGWGYAAFAIDHRLAPEHHFPAAVADVQCAVAWLRAHAAEYDVDSGRVALLGTSSGGHLAALAGLAAAPSAPSPSWQPSCGDPAADVRVQAVVSCFGPLDLAFHAQESKGAQRIVTTFLGQPCQDAPDLCAAASPVTYVTADAPQALLIHGADDDAVSCENSERMHAALQAAGAEAVYLPIEGAQHSFIFKFQTEEAQVALNGIEDFLAEAFSTNRR